MANDISANPWFIDTPGAGLIYGAYVRIKNILWSDQVAAGDQLIIQDRNGKTIANAKAPGANQIQFWGVDNWVNGLKVTTLTAGGIVQIYLK